MPMPVLYDCLGFETGLITSTLAQTEFDALSVGTGGTLSAVAGGSGNYMLNASTGSSSVVSCGERDWGADLDTICIELYVTFTAVPAALTRFCSLLDATPNPIADLSVDATGHWALYNYGNTTAYTSTGAPVIAGQTYRIQLKMTAHASAGTIDWKTGVTLEPGISGLTGLNTKPGGAFRRYRVGVTVAQSNAGARQIDDVIVADDWIGAGVVRALWPISNAIANWTVVTSGGATSWQTMKDIPWASSTSDLIRSNTTFQEERYDLAPLASDLGAATILGLCPVIRQRRVTAGSTAAVSVLLRSGLSDGASVTVDSGNASFVTKRGATLALDPATGAAWTLDGVNAAKLRILHDSGSNSCDVNAALVYAAFARGADAAILENLAGEKHGRRFGVAPGVPGIDDYYRRRGRLPHRVTK